MPSQERPLPFFNGWHSYFKVSSIANATLTLDRCSPWNHVRVRLARHSPSPPFLRACKTARVRVSASPCASVHALVRTFGAGLFPRACARTVSSRDAEVPERAAKHANWVEAAQWAPSLGISLGAKDRPAATSSARHCVRARGGRALVHIHANLSQALISITSSESFSFNVFEFGR